MFSKNPSYPLARYCLEGDDSIIESLLRSFSSGRYVEVGANHPVNENVTFRLSQLGWLGLSIDATPSLSSDWAEHRPEDNFLIATVSSKTQIADLVQYEDPSLNSISTLAHEKAEQDNEIVLSRELKSTSVLSELLESQGISRVDFLSINARSADLEILKGYDFDRVRPKLVRIEMLYFNFGSPSAHPIYNFLDELGFVLVVKTLRNGFWIDPDAREFSWLPQEMFSTSPGKTAPKKPGSIRKKG